MLWAWLGALIVGISLGLLGSGGSILTVPILIYGVGLNEKLAFASSLAIVGLISAFSAYAYAKRGQIIWRSVFWFGLPGMAGAIGGAYIAKYLPSWVQLLLFSVLLLVAAYLMFRPVVSIEDRPQQRAVWKVALDGFFVGVITSLVGVGGGFLIIPALVLLGGLSMSMAVGTSLIIIAMNAASGFYTYLHVLSAFNLHIDWLIVTMFAGLGIVGGLIGQRLSDRIPQHRLRHLFGVFLVLMGVFMLWQNLPEMMKVMT